jgi:hypothetical protein
MSTVKWEGNEIGPEIALKITEYIKENFKNTNTQILKSVYSCALELLLNIKHHAYPNKYEQKPCDLWNITISQLNQDIISISIEDEGITIPVSVINKIEVRAGQNREIHTDTSIIERVVFNKGMVSEKGRGQGYSSIINDIDKKLITGIIIESRNGYYLYSNINLDIKRENIKTINGTKVEVFISNLVNKL